MSFVSINSINLNFNAKICPTLAAMAALPWCFYVQMMPTLLARTNRDVVAIAEHGCGKTLAYAVPLLIRAAALQGQHKNTLQITLLRVIPTMTFIHFLTGKSSGILSDISSDILFDILSGISSGI